MSRPALPSPPLTLPLPTSSRSAPLLAAAVAGALSLACGLTGCGPAEEGTGSGGSGGVGGAGGSVSSGGSGVSGGSGAGGSGATGPWRSALYPEGWTPAFEDEEGRFLHDFSYAGYRYGEEPDTGDLPVLDAVAEYGADASGETDSTAAVQAALDDAAAAGGSVVFLSEGLFRFDGVLRAGASSIVLRGAGAEATKLYFTRTEGMSDTAHILFDAPLTVQQEASLVEDGQPREATLAVADVDGFAPGDDVAIGFVITPEFVEEHGMTGVWQAFNGTWQTFFRRTVVSVDASSSPPTLTVDVPLRYPVKVADGASVRRETGYLSGVGVESLAVSNAVGWDAAWELDRTHAIEIAHAKDGFVRDVASFSSPAAPQAGGGVGAHLLSGGVLVRESKRVSVLRSEMGLAENRGNGGNGYLFEIQRSSEVLVADSRGTGGRHNFIQNWGFGTTGCVLLRVVSREGKAFNEKDGSGFTSLSEYHHSLATANLVDSSSFDDGFSTVNRNGESTGAGHTGTQNAFWNVRGKGMLRSLQLGWGYVVGTAGLSLVMESALPMGTGTAPVDWLEGEERAADLEPPSLYEDQRKKRLGE